MPRTCAQSKVVIASRHSSPVAISVKQLSSQAFAIYLFDLSEH
jgi:hypothetical protein